MKRLLLALLLAVGCGESTTEIESQLFDTFDPAFGGYIMNPPGIAFTKMQATFVESFSTGTSGDGVAQHIDIGPVDGVGICIARVGTITVVGGGGTHSMFVLYASTVGGGQLVGSAISTHTYDVKMETTDAGNHMNFQITDQNTGAVTFRTITKPGDCSFGSHSAGALIERPVWGGTVRPLANYSNGDFSNVIVFDKFGAPHHLDEFPQTNHVTMVNGPTFLETTSALGTDAFNTTWNARL